MSQSEFGWESLLDSDARAKYAIKAALLTTYDRPDERFLVEDLLPKLLKLDGQPLSEGDAGRSFLGKLDLRLKQLRDNFVVVSSTVRETTTDDEDDTQSVWLDLAFDSASDSRKQWPCGPTCEALAAALEGAG